MANNRIHEAYLKAMKRMEGYLELPREDEDEEDLQVRLERLEEVWSQLSANHMKWISGKGNDVDEASERQADAEELYLGTKRKFRKRISAIAQRKREQRVEKETASGQAIEVSIQVPPQQEVKNTWGSSMGPSRSGKSSGHENEQVKPAFKFQHLAKSLTGKAARTSGEWQLTEGNYLEAWARLNQLYDKKYQTCRELLRQFLSLPCLQATPRADQIQRLSNVTHETLRQLKAQGIPVEYWDMIVVHLLHKRLDADTARQWELQRQSETPTSKEMLAFLDRQASGSTQPTSSHQAKAAFMMSGAVARKGSRQRFDKFSSERVGQQGNTAGQSKQGMKPSINWQGSKPSRAIRHQHRCELCGEEHQLYHCKQFRVFGPVS
ncbi:uncharacterized protein LOC129952573 [Eupeodes corollae]|uniref:uncharacterized protein LOC129952573 n=1 Tax=Eupeodes corollae TaxID=290404 RepID=UPI002492CB4B|nr:uncharacterized protein LOC129952573 [Eupeodes corollae]